MKKITQLVPAVMVVMLLFVAASAQAQPRRLTPEQRADNLAKNLSLTSEQKAKVLEVFTTQDDSMKAAFAAHRGDHPAMREAMQAIRDTTEMRMKEILTDDQYTAWLKTRPAMRGRGRRGDD
jgi:protein CpxP